MSMESDWTSRPAGADLVNELPFLPRQTEQSPWSGFIRDLFGPSQAVNNTARDIFQGNVMNNQSDETYSWGQGIQKQPSHVQEFFNKIKDPAVRVGQQLNIPPAAVAAQWALESGYGQSALAKNSNNYGGIKAQRGWTGKSVAMPTYEKNRTVKETANFRAYDSVDDYANDYVTFINKERYKPVLGAKTPYDYALALGRAGYHQDDPEEYAKQIQQIAQRFQ